MFPNLRTARSMTRLSLSAAAAVALAAGVMMPGSAATGVPTVDPYADLPESLTLTGTVRDFKGRDQTGGHADFQWQPTGGFGHYVGQCADTLDSDGKPVFASRGFKVSTQAKDAAGRQRMSVNKDYISSRSGDVAGANAASHGGANNGATGFNQWFRDVSGVNLSMPLPIRLVRQANTNIYTFNDRNDSTYSTLGGFFPINNQLLGNSGGTTPNQNFHFTYELDTNFRYRRGTGQLFTFTGDDDVFVFIDGKLVVDIGGVHSAVSQTIDLDRLNWLQDNQRYNLKLFFAERHRTQSNVRIDTTITLENASLPATSPLYD
ncbi:MAG: fibro-slime domain-containing protein [Phycisphaerales bacterium]